MKYLPLFIDVTDGRCLVVGGGAVAARKVMQLRKAGASVDLVAPEIGADLHQLADAGQVTHHARGFRRDDADGHRLIIAASDDGQLNRRVADAARALNIPVNVVDNPELCTFITPSTVDRSPVQIAVSTGGASPVLARVFALAHRGAAAGGLRSAWRAVGALP